MKDSVSNTPDNKASRLNKPGFLFGLGASLILLTGLAIQYGPSTARNLGEGIGKAKCTVPFIRAAFTRLDGKLGYNPDLTLRANLINNQQQMASSAEVIVFGGTVCNIQ